MLRVYIANLGKYNEGELVGEWVNLPITEDDLEEVYERIGISEEPDQNGIIYEETAIHDYETDLDLVIGEWDNVLELSEQLEEYEQLQEWEQDIVAAILEAGEYNDLFEAVAHVGDFNLLPGVDDDEKLGLYYYRSGCIEIPEYLINYFDFEAYGRDCSFDGTYTENGFLYRCQGVEGMKKAYIFRNGRYWYIDYFEDLQEAEQSARDGWNVDLYVTTRQIYGGF